MIMSAGCATGKNKNKNQYKRPNLVLSGSPPHLMNWWGSGRHGSVGGCDSHPSGLVWALGDPELPARLRAGRHRCCCWNMWDVKSSGRRLRRNSLEHPVTGESRGDRGVLNRKESEDLPFLPHWSHGAVICAVIWPSSLYMHRPCFT